MRHVTMGMAATLGLLLGAAAAGGDDMPATVAGNTAFAVDLYGKLRERPGNLFASPQSLSTALAMTYGGARGATAEQMARALHFAQPADALHAGFGSLAAAIHGKGEHPYELNVANALWIQKDYAIRPEFLAVAREHYGAGPRPLGFAESEEARRTINAWVEEQTRDKIRDLLPSGTITPLTRLVLTNAIYFKGDWQQPFAKEATLPEPFHLAGGQDVSVPMMNQTGRFSYAEADGTQVVALPYKGGDLEMVIALPKAGTPLDALEGTLQAGTFDAWAKALQPNQVALALPRFKMESSFEMKSTLESLGMVDAFDDRKADLSGIAGPPGELAISAVVHKAFVDVNETGTEAAAATGVVIGVRSAAAPRKPVVVRADRPFLFLIRHKPTGAVLFLGRVADPRG